MENTKVKKYNRQKAINELWALDWVDLFQLFKTPAGSWRQMHDHAGKVLLHVSRAFAAMPPKAFREAGTLQNAVEAAIVYTV